MPEKTLNNETLLVTSRFNIERVTQSLPDGQLHRREVVRHPGAVVILPVLDDGSICLIKNYRVAVNQTLLELPAGTLDAGEPPLQTAHRELAEETGYRCGSMQPLCEFFMSPGILDERMHAFVATELMEGKPARETGEQIENVLVSPEELDQLIRAGRIQDSKSLSALHYFLRYST